MIFFLVVQQVIKLTEQNIQNLTFDKSFDVIAVEALGYDGTNLTRINVTSSGYLKVTL